MAFPVESFIRGIWFNRFGILVGSEWDGDGPSKRNFGEKSMKYKEMCTKSFWPKKNDSFKRVRSNLNGSPWYAIDSMRIGCCGWK
jgi:hypothetical protein